MHLVGLYTYCKVMHGVYSVKLILNSLNRIPKNSQTSNLMKIRSVGAELLNADGKTDENDEANSASRSCVNAPKNCTKIRIRNSL